jgi:hypothetical protein
MLQDCLGKVACPSRLGGRGGVRALTREGRGLIHGHPGRAPWGRGTRPTYASSREGDIRESRRRPGPQTGMVELPRFPARAQWGPRLGKSLGLSPVLPRRKVRLKPSGWPRNALSRSLPAPSTRTLVPWKMRSAGCLRPPTRH